MSASLASWQAEFQRLAGSCPAQIVDYVSSVTTALLSGAVRISPRRTRLLTRTLLASLIVKEGAAVRFGTRQGKDLFFDVLESSLPHRAWGEVIERDKIRAAHELAWSSVMLTGSAQWLHRLHLEPTLDGKASLLLRSCPDPDTGSVAIEQLLANESRPRAAAFALAAFPAAVTGTLPIGAEAVSDLGRAAQPLLTVEGEVSWQEHLSQSGSQHPELAAYGELLSGLKGARRKRAEQLLYYCAIHRLPVGNAKAFEAEFDRCVRAFATRVTS